MLFLSQPDCAIEVNFGHIPLYVLWQKHAFSSWKISVQSYIYADFTKVTISGQKMLEFPIYGGVVWLSRSMRCCPEFPIYCGVVWIIRTIEVSSGDPGRQMDGRMDRGWIDGWVYVDGWMDRRTDGRMGGWMSG